MTLPLIKVADHDLQFNFDEIAKRVVDTGGRQIKLRMGSVAVTWPGGSANSNATTITHGVGSTPISVLATVGAVTGLNANPAVRVSSVGSTTFQVSAATIDAQTPLGTATTTVYWLAIG